MSNCTQEFSRFVQLSNVDSQKAPSVLAVDGAQGGQTASIIMDPNAPFWTVVMQRLAAAGVTRSRCRRSGSRKPDANPTLGWPMYAVNLKGEFEAILQVIHSKFPNSRQCYVASRIYAGYATSMLNPEPYCVRAGVLVQVDDRGPDQRDLVAELRPGARTGRRAVGGLGDVQLGRRARAALGWTDVGVRGFPARRDAPVGFGAREGRAGAAPVRPHGADGGELVLGASGAGAVRRREADVDGDVADGRMDGDAELRDRRFRVHVHGGDAAEVGARVPRTAARGRALPRRDRDALGRGTAAPPPVHVLDGSGGSSWPIAITPSMIGTTRFYQGSRAIRATRTAPGSW
jgi:hypothetical protein